MGIKYAPNLYKFIKGCSGRFGTSTFLFLCHEGALGVILKSHCSSVRANDREIKCKGYDWKTKEND